MTFFILMSIGNAFCIAFLAYAIIGIQNSIRGAESRLDVIEGNRERETKAAIARAGITFSNSDTAKKRREMLDKQPKEVNPKKGKVNVVVGRV